MQIARQDAWLVARLEHHRAGTIAEQHAGRAIVEIQDAREHFRADHQRALGTAGLDHGIGHGQGVDEAAADRLHVEGGTAGDAQLVLQDGGRRGKHHVRRRGGDDDQIDVGGQAACGLQRMPRRFQAQIAAGDIRRREMPRADAGAFDDPLIGSLETPLRELACQIIVGEATRRQVAAGTGDAGEGGHQACNAAGAVTSAADPGAGGCVLASRGAARAMRERTRSSRLLRAAS